MVRNRKPPEDPFVLNWSDKMNDAFIDALEKQHDLGKRSDTGFKSEAWVYCVAQVQNVYSGKETIPAEKLKNKLDHWKKRWNDWKWVGKQSGIGRDWETGFYTASATTWEMIFCERPRVRWCRTGILEYEQSLDKIFGGRAAFGEKAAPIWALRSNTTTCNDVFDPRLLAYAGEQDGERDTQGDSSYLGSIGNEFGLLSEGEELFEESDTRPPTKKAKLYHSVGTLSKDLNQFGDETHNPQAKINEKKSTCLELAGLMNEWRTLREKEYEQRELAKLCPEARVMRNIRENYAEEVEKLSYEEYVQLVLLLRTSHEDFGGYYTGAEYYTMMDGSSSKFRNELMKKWFEKIKSQPKVTTTIPSLNSAETK